MQVLFLRRNARPVFAGSAWRAIALVAFCLTVIPLLCMGQSYTASVAGVVTDPLQAGVPSARIIVKDAARNLEYPGSTDGAGRFLVTALPPGIYTLTVEAIGFKRYARGEFELLVQQLATIDVQLEVGQVTTTVEVEASAPLLNVTSAALGQVIENNYILALPLTSRASFDLVTLAAGVTPPLNKPEGNGLTSNFVAAGGRNLTTDIFLDGVSLSNIGLANGYLWALYQPSIDTVQEFKVQVNHFSAEFGYSGSAVVNMVTKSGTNKLHGSAYELYQNSALNANNWFSNRAGQTLPDAHQSVFGATAGGPVWLPKLYNGRNRTFFFFSYEGNRSGSAVSQLVTVPSLQERQGDFSQTRAANGQLISIYNPYDTVSSSGVTLRQPFPGNVIPLSMQSQVGRNVLSYYPKPTADGIPFTHVNNYFAQAVNPFNNNSVTFKLDQNLNDRHRFTSRYSILSSAQTYGDLWGNISSNFNTKSVNQRSQNFVFDYTNTISPTTVLDLRYGLLRYFRVFVPLSDGFDPASLGMSDVVLANGVKVFPVFNLSGYQTIGNNSSAPTNEGHLVNSFMGNLTKTSGAHTFKAGAEMRIMQLNYWQPGSTVAGSFSFTPNVTNQSLVSTNSLQGNSVASLFLDWGGSGQYNIGPPSAMTSKYYAGFAEDTWKVSRRLTATLGLRYDLESPATDRYNRLSWFDPSQTSPIASKMTGSASCPACGALKGAMDFADSNTRSAMDISHTNFQPRVGLAYALGTKTSVRAGYGLFYTVSMATSMRGVGTGYSTVSTMQWSLDGGATRYASLENPFPGGLTLPVGSSQGASTFLGQNISSVTRSQRNPQYQSWNVSIQRALPGKAVLEINYNGSKGTHLYYGNLQYINLLPEQYWNIGRTALTQLVPNPFYGVITDPTSTLSLPTVARNRLLYPYPQYLTVAGQVPNRADSIYHAVQLRYEKRLSHGLSFLGHYTFAKTIDDTANTQEGLNTFSGVTFVQDPFNLRAERSLSAQDIAQRLLLTFSYELPVGRGRAIGGSMWKPLNTVVGGWQVSGITNFSTGYPIITALQSGILWNGTQRPNLTGDPAAPGSVEDRLNQYFNAASFSRPASDTFGTAPRTLTYRTPGLRTANLSLMKNVTFAERKQLQFRMETFNAMNTPRFAPPNTTYGSSAFGVISGTGPARTLQVGVKFYY